MPRPQPRQTVASYRAGSEWRDRPVVMTASDEVTMIDRQPPQLHPQTFGMRQSRPTTVSYGTGLAERRGRHSGQIDAKPCGRCHTAVALDPRRMRLADGQAVIACLSCGTLVSCRRSDLHRAAPDTPPEPPRLQARRGWWARKRS